MINFCSIYSDEQNKIHECVRYYNSILLIEVHGKCRFCRNAEISGNLPKRVKGTCGSEGHAEGYINRHLRPA